MHAEDMANALAPPSAHVTEALNAVRAAIDVVQSGAARRVVVSDPAGIALLPTARALGQSAGVRVEPEWRADDRGCDIVVEQARSER